MSVARAGFMDTTVLVIALLLSTHAQLALAVAVEYTLPRASLTFTHLTTSQGLSQNTIHAIAQDLKGFMWFATRDGLNRFDGYSVIVFKHNPSDPNSISDNFIQDMIVGRGGDVWLGTNSGGINRFNPITEQFIHYRNEPRNPNSLSSDGILSLHQDRQGNVWAGTHVSGLNRLDPVSSTVTRYPLDEEGAPFQRIMDITEDDQGNIWFAGDRGVFRLDGKTSRITRPLASLGKLKVTHVTYGEDGNIWLLANEPDSLFKYSPQSGQHKEYPLDTPNPLLGVPGSNLLEDGNNGFWVPTGQGLYQFDRQTERFTLRFRHDQTNPDSLGSDVISSVFRDSAGLFWLGTESDGVSILDFQQGQFGTYRHHPGYPAASLSPGRVTAIHQASDGTLWLGFYRRALNRLDRSTGEVTRYVPDPGSDNALSPGTNLNSIHKDTQGDLWLGGWDSGLSRFNDQSGQFSHFHHNPDDPDGLISNHVLSLHEDPSGQLWVGQFGGLSKLDVARERFTHYRHDPSDPTSLGHPDVSIIYQDRSGLIWLGTWGGVLSRFDAQANAFTNYRPEPGNPDSLTGGPIYALHEDPAGYLWVGASDGLYQFDRKQQTFTRFTDNQGLPSSTIEGILEDKAGHLWLSTKNGLSRFNPQTKVFRNYNETDGLQGNDFSESCYAQGQSGEFFFCGNDGFNAFFPESIQDNPFVPPVAITDFKIFNKAIPINADSVLPQAIAYTDALTLSHQDRVFTLEFSALSYATPEKNQYRYRLEGLEADWNEVDSKQRLATYTNLDPGRYRFQLQASNSDGVWNEQGASLPITITPPWWETLWFRSLTSMLLVTLALAVYFYRTRQIRQRTKELEAQVAQRTVDLQVAKEHAEAANRAKSLFLANMGHELRTPLNAVMGFSELLSLDSNLNDDQQESLQIINRSGEHLLRLINDILDMAKIEAGQCILNIAPFNLEHLVRDVASMMHIQADKRNLQLRVEHAPSLPRYIEGDEARLRQILVNLVGNALKFTQEGGVAIRLQAKPDASDVLVIEVEDTGIGIDAEQQAKIFEPFVQLGMQGGQSGTGLGLAITRQIVHLMGGSIRLESTPGKGTLFTIHLPLTVAREDDVVKPTHKRVVKHLAPGQPSYRILIVEDQVDNQQLLSRILESAGFEVKIALDGEQSIELYKQWSPHLIWMDRRLPGLDGMAATQRIRNLPGGKAVKIVALTASAFSDERQEMLDGGMDDYLSKPYRAADIYDCLATHLSVEYVYETVKEK